MKFENRMNHEFSTDANTWVREAYMEHAQPLTRYAYSLCHDVERARDAVQETFLRLCREEREKIEARLVPWLFRVCRSRVLDQHRKEDRVTAIDTDILAARPDGAQSPADDAELSETTRIVLALVVELPPNQREVVRLKFQNGLSYKQIAEVTELSVGNVGFLLHSAIQGLRTKIKSRTDLIPNAE